MTEGMLMFGMGIIAGAALVVGAYVCYKVWTTRLPGDPGTWQREYWANQSPFTFVDPETLASEREVRMAQAEARRAGHNTNLIN